MNTILKFLVALNTNNNKEWFDANKQNYQKAKQEFINVVTQVIDSCASFDPMLKGIEANKTLFRINRDVRFSKDKSPYKTNFGASIKPGGKKSMIPGYYIHIEPGKSFLAAGTYMPIPAHLSAIRQEIDYNLKDFTKIVNEKDFIKEFGALSNEDALKTVPKGYDKENPALEFLKMKHFIAIKYLDNKEIIADDFVKHLTKTLKTSLALTMFLRKAIN